MKKATIISKINISIYEDDTARLGIFASADECMYDTSKPNLILHPFEVFPDDGIYDFDFWIYKPTLFSQKVDDKAVALYIWKNYPKDIVGIRIHSEENTVLFTCGESLRIQNDFIQKKKLEGNRFSK